MQKRSFFIGLVALLCGGLLLFELTSIAHQYCQDKRNVTITVFVHGSVYTMLGFLDPRRILSDNLPANSLYVDMVKRVRKNPLIWQDQIMLEEGWHGFSQQNIESFYNNSLSTQDRQKAAFSFVPSYNMIAECCGDSDTDYVYFLFGHLGLLSQSYRREIAEELYHNLCDVIGQYSKRYWRVQLDIVTHSHAGNIVLNLVPAERKYGRGLVVNNLIMYGAPIQKETVVYVYDSVFERVLNNYSDGDRVQGNDRMSTSARFSCKRIFDERLEDCLPEPSQTQVYDIRWLVNGNTTRIGHANMWLMGRDVKATDCLDPLPVPVLTPVLLSIIDQHPYDGHFDCNVVEKHDNLSLALLHHADNTELAVSDNVYLTAEQAQRLTHSNWESTDKSRMLLFNYQTGAALLQAFQEWRNEGFEGSCDE